MRVPSLQREYFTFAESNELVMRMIERSDGSKNRTWLRNRMRYGLDAHSAFDYSFLRKQQRFPRNRTGTLRFADMYSGCGGLSLGVAEACRAIGVGFECLLAIDHNPTCLGVFKRNIECLRTYPNDVSEILDGEIGSKPSSRERNFLNYAKRTTLLISGPPCEGNSDLNNHTRRKDPRNLLYERVARFAELVKPQHILVENVPNIVHGKEGALITTIEVLRDLGYCVDTGVVDLSQLGVPQKRRRHITVASLTKNVSVTKVVQNHSVEHPRSVWWAIDDLQNVRPNDAYDEASKQTKENLTRMRYLHAKRLLNLPDRFRPKCHKENDHSYKSMYGRLSKIKPSQTITSGFGSPGQGRFIHPSKMRTLTPHEAARLQFFPDYFDFSSVKSRSELASMIGNAAPNRLSYSFCLELLA